MMQMFVAMSVFFFYYYFFSIIFLSVVVVVVAFVFDDILAEVTVGPQATDYHSVCDYVYRRLN